MRPPDRAEDGALHFGAAGHVFDEAFKDRQLLPQPDAFAIGEIGQPGNDFAGEPLKIINDCARGKIHRAQILRPGVLHGRSPHFPERVRKER